MKFVNMEARLKALAEAMGSMACLGLSYLRTQYSQCANWVKTVGVNNKDV